MSASLVSSSIYTLLENTFNSMLKLIIFVDSIHFNFEI